MNHPHHDYVETFMEIQNFHSHVKASLYECIVVIDEKRSIQALEKLFVR